MCSSRNPAFCCLLGQQTLLEHPFFTFRIEPVALPPQPHFDKFLATRPKRAPGLPGSPEHLTHGLDQGLQNFTVCVRLIGCMRMRTLAHMRVLYVVNVCAGVVDVCGSKSFM